jgi:hypothetical protein
MAPLRAFSVLLAAALPALAWLTPVQAADAYCPYVVVTHYASVYARPSVYSTIYDAMPHGTEVFASAGTIAGAGGSFRELVTSAGTAYARTTALGRVSGSCFATEARRS